MNTLNLPPLPKPDTHCLDEDTGKDVWSHSPEQMQAYATAAIKSQAQQHPDKQAKPPASVVQQEPVAWMVMNGVCTYQLCGSEKSAVHLSNELQKRHDLSGSLAAFHVRPLVFGDTHGIKE